MTQPIHLIAEIYAVEVPDPGNAIVSGNVITWRKGEAVGRGFIVMPPGNWQLICTTKECTEDIAKGIVGLQHHNFKEWWINFGKRDSYYTRAICSLRSLLTSKGLDVEKNFVLIKKLP